MTHPTTEQSIRERLARALWAHDCRVLRDNGFSARSSDPWDSAERRASYVAQVDAILAELQEPSEGMLIAVRDALAAGEIDSPGAWGVMIQHIRDGGQ